MTPTQLTPAARGGLAVVAHATRYELLGLMRNKRARFIGFVFPVVLLVLLSAAFGSGHVDQDGQSITMSRFYLPGILALTVTTSCFAALVTSVVSRRQLGVLKRRRAAPVPASVVVISSSLATATLALSSAALMLAIGRLLYGVGISGPNLAVTALFLVLATLSFSAVAYAVASIIPSPEATEPIVRLVTFPIFMISGIWFPVSGLPRGVRAIADAFPVAPLANGLHHAFAGATLSTAFSLGNLAIIVAWGVVATVVATRRFTWLPSRATA